MFQAYLVVCATSGKGYIGITGRSVRRRWVEHVRFASNGSRDGALYLAIAKYGADNFTIEAICSSRSWAGICAVESTLIAQHGTLAPNGYNLTTGGEGRSGYRPSKDAVERSAAKHRGRPCHENTRRAASEYHKGRPKSVEARTKSAASRTGVARPEAMKAKLRAYWAKRRAAGEFKTAQPYAHARKVASAMIAKIPLVLSRHIGKSWYPERAA